MFWAIYKWVRELQPSSISPFSTTCKWWRRKGAPRRQRTEEGNICYVTWSGGAASYLLSLYNATTASKKTSFSSVGARANANLLSQRSTHSDFLPNNRQNLTYKKWKRCSFFLRALWTYSANDANGQFPLCHLVYVLDRQHGVGRPVRPFFFRVPGEHEQLWAWAGPMAGNHEVGTAAFLESSLRNSGGVSLSLSLSLPPPLLISFLRLARCMEISRRDLKTSRARFRCWSPRRQETFYQ